MFTGIVRAVGRTTARRPAGDGVRIAVDVTRGDLGGPRIGDSIAVAGCCLTVVAIAGESLEFDASAETLARTTGFPQGGAVNLESALRLADRLDGHLVSGHVDGTGVVAAFREVAGNAGSIGGAGSPGGAGSVLLAVDAPEALARFIAPKGSIAVDGVSLTTNTVADAPDGTARFTVNLIAHTLAMTTLGSLFEGAVVNLEVDLLARYLDRLRRADESGSAPWRNQAWT